MPTHWRRKKCGHPSLPYPPLPTSHFHYSPASLTPLPLLLSSHVLETSQWTRLKVHNYCVMVQELNLEESKTRGGRRNGMGEKVEFRLILYYNRCICNNHGTFGESLFLHESEQRGLFWFLKRCERWGGSRGWHRGGRSVTTSWHTLFLTSICWFTLPHPLCHCRQRRTTKQDMSPIT